VGVSLSSHQSARSKNDEWLTPPEIRGALGRFDLDPCSPELAVRPWSTAAHHYTKSMNGLSMSWHGRVWLNPPFGREAVKWMAKMAAHGNGIALLAARTETAMFFDYVWGKASAILFLKGRPHFHYVTGERAKANSGAPICLIAYGSANADCLASCGIPGAFVRLRQPSLDLEAA
jgi:hypothetical protein